MQGFTNQSLADKLAKLNSSQQSIETLSHWCIFHRRSAKQVVDIWERQFFLAPREQRVPFLYLANDILQNSRRKGSEFVSEFWRVLSGALRDVVKNGDDGNRSTVLRLIDIWEERKVFGSHPQGLRVELLGRDAPSSTKNFAQGGDGLLLPEKLVAVYKVFSDKLAGEDAVIDKCSNAFLQAEGLEKDIDVSTISGQESGAIVLEELQHSESALMECIQQLEAAEIARSSIVFQLKETLREQETKQEQVRILLQAAHSHTEHNRAMQQHVYDALNGQSSPSSPPPPPEGDLANGEPYEDVGARHEDDVEEYVPSESYAHRGDDDGDTEGSYVPKFDPIAAAEVAAKLASSTALSSVLSSLVADTVVAPLPSAVVSPLEDHHGYRQSVPQLLHEDNNGRDGHHQIDEIHHDEDHEAEPPSKKAKVDLEDKVENDAMTLVDDGIIMDTDTVTQISTAAATMTMATGDFMEHASALWQGLGLAGAASAAGAAGVVAPPPPGRGSPPENYHQSNPLSFFTPVPPQQ